MISRIPHGRVALFVALTIACGDGAASRAVPGAVPGMQPGSGEGFVKLEGAVGAAAQAAGNAPAGSAARQGGGATAADTPASEPPSEAPQLELRGYVVRTTDELSFRRCEGSRVYFVNALGQEAARLVQYHRFSASSALSPVYVVFKGRLRDDTVTIGEHRYRGVVDVEQVMVEKSTTASPACPPPPRGSMIRR